MALLPGGISTEEGHGAPRAKGCIRSWKPWTWRTRMGVISGAGNIASLEGIGAAELQALVGWIINAGNIASAAAFGTANLTEPGMYDWLLVDNADRLYPWGDYCGIPGGIPNRTTIYTTLSSGATPSQINSAVAACPSDQVVLLGAGTFTVSSAILFNAGKSGVTLRGSGPGVTILNLTGSGRGIEFTSADYSESNGRNVSSGYGKGSMAIVLSSAPGATFAAGNLVYINEDNNPNKWATDIGPYLRDGHRPTRYNIASTGTPDYGRTVNYTSRIASVSGNTINLETPIPVAFNSLTAIRAYPPDSAQNVRLCGVENLTIDGANSANYTNAIRGYNPDRCWVKDVEIKNMSGCDTGHIGIIYGFQCEVRRCFLRDCQGYPTQQDGQGIDFDFFSANCLAVDNIAYRIATLTQANADPACAFLYNLGVDMARYDATYQNAFILHHGGHGSMNLFEGNIGNMIQADGYHGSMSHEMLFRNQFHGLSPGYPSRTEMRGMVQLERWNYYFSCIGNILGDSSWTATAYENNDRLTTGNDGMIYNLGYAYEVWHGIDCSYYDAGRPDPNVPATILRHGNYDYYNHATVWSGGITSHAIPNSLFYSSKPSFFGSLAWPPIGPDLGTMVSDTPAKRRWDNYVISGTLSDLFADAPGV